MGMSIPRKVGHAVIRNKIRRRLRACIDGIENSMAPGLYVLYVYPGAAAMSYTQLCGTLSQLVNRAVGSGSVGSQ